MLFENWNLGLRGDDDVSHARGSALVRRNAGENPRTALLIHDFACAVDGVDEQTPTTIRVGRTVRENQRAARQAFGDETERLTLRDFLEAFDEHLLAHAI